MRLKQAKIVIFIFIFLIGSNVVLSQDFEQTLEESAPVVTDNSIPEPAPIFLDESIPSLDKDSIRLRLKRLEKDIPLSYNNNIISFIHYFTVRNREYSKMVLRRKDTYFEIFERILKENNMPDELKYLSIVESGLNPRARSRAGAVGLWQFVPNTGKYYKLNIDWYIDERSDPEKSTQAACQYLKYLHKMFNNWELALAAYNCGPGNVRRAIKASRNKRDFWEIYYNLPRETRSYVPQFIAISYLMNYNKEHNLFADYYENFSNYHIVHTDQYVNLDVLAGFLNVCPDDLQRLNPTLLRNRVPSYVKNFPLKIPADRVHLLMENYCSIMDSCSRMGDEEMREDINLFSERQLNRNSIVHIVRRGDVLGKIATKYHVSVSELRRWNNLRGNSVKYGQKLTVWRENRQKNDDKKLTATTSVRNQFKNRKQVYKVQPGDTLWSISQKLSLSMDKIRRMNRLKSTELKPGQKLILS